MRGIEGIADQFAVEQVLDASKVKSDFIGGDVGDVRHPRVVRCRHSKLPIQQVWRPWQGLLRIRRRLESALVACARIPFSRISRSTRSLLAGNPLPRSSRTMRGLP